MAGKVLEGIPAGAFLRKSAILVGGMIAAYFSLSSHLFTFSKIASSENINNWQ
jgi:hypothetical protein